MEPEIDADVEPQMLDKEARSRLRTLSKSNSDHVAQHLVMAGRLIDSDPERAYEHAKVAVSSAGRVDVAREALALTAYATARYAEALREIRTVRRLSGIDAHPAIEADCERGLGRPERALDVLTAARGLDLPEDELVEMAIVESGARADLKEYDAGLVVVENMAARVKDGALRERLHAVRADRLDELGRGAEASQLRATLPTIAVDVIVADLGGDEPEPAPVAAPAAEVQDKDEVDEPGLETDEPEDEVAELEDDVDEPEVESDEPEVETDEIEVDEPELETDEPEVDEVVAQVEPATEADDEAESESESEPAQLELFETPALPLDQKDDE